MNRALLTALLITVLVPALALPGAAGPGHVPAPANEGGSEQRLERFFLDGRDLLDAVTGSGFDVTHDTQRVPGGFESEIVVNDADVATLQAMGARLLDESEYFDWSALEAPGRAAAATFPRREGALAQAMVIDEVTIGRVDYFTTKGQGFLSVEAKSTFESQSAAMLLTWDDGTAGVPAGAQVMTAFTDSGEYMYHRLVTTVETKPATVTVLSTLGGTDTAPVTEWLYDVDSPLDDPSYQTGFIDGYMDPTDLYARIEQLADAHPDIAEIVPLNHLTNGYQRKAQAVIGSGSSSVVAMSTAWGHEGGNDVTVEYVTGTEAGVAVDGSAVTVTITATSTAQDVIDLLNTTDVVTGRAYRTSGTNGVVTPTSPVALTDGLEAHDGIPRGPYQPRAIHITADVANEADREQKPGVLIIAQDHAREWVPPLVALEAVERLLANYAAGDPGSIDIVENTEIWVVPSNNPDGSHYSFHDYDLQRKNMTNHCLSEQPQYSDPGYADSWGVDLNRGYSVATRQDGFAGASGTCTSSTYSGPYELSEPEAQNVVGLVEDNPNIAFFMTIHSNGGQLFWQPGAYIADGRLTPTRPELRDETYYWTMAERILSHVKTYQDTVVRPDKVGGSSDVLYSSAGNVREELYVNYGVYAFGWEVGGAVWNPTTRTWSSGSFQPAWSQAQGEYMEYASGVTEMFRIAADHGRDNQAPTTSLEAVEGGYAFTADEAVRINYTTDGSAPTADSPVYRASGIREPGEVLGLPAGTTVRWLAVDPAGNVEDERSQVID